MCQIWERYGNVEQQPEWEVFSKDLRDVGESRSIGTLRHLKPKRKTETISCS